MTGLRTFLTINKMAPQAFAELDLQRVKKDGDVSSVEYKKDRSPGDLGCDPSGPEQGLWSGCKGLHNMVVNTGRRAMIGLTTFPFKEFVVKDATLASKFL